MSRKLRSNNANLAFNDLLFNVLIGFVMLFIIAFILINPIAKEGDVPSKVEVMIILQWEDKVSDDIDLWVQRNNDLPVGFSNDQNAPLHLDRDDLGFVNDEVSIDGNTEIILSNSETISIRGKAPGDYYISVHYYNKRKREPLKYDVTVIQVNPFKQIYSINGTIQNSQEIQRLPAFTVDSEGKVSDVYNHARNVVPTGSTD